METAAVLSVGFSTAAADSQFNRIPDDRRLSTKDYYTYCMSHRDYQIDVSAVSIPANDFTEISARSFVDGILDKEKAEAWKLNRGGGRFRRSESLWR